MTTEIQKLETLLEEGKTYVVLELHKLFSLIEKHDAHPDLKAGITALTNAAPSITTPTPLEIAIANTVDGAGNDSVPLSVSGSALEAPATSIASTVAGGAASDIIPPAGGVA